MAAGPLRAAIGNTNQNLRQGLVAYYKFDEAQGSTIRDSSPTGLSPSIINASPVWVPGKFGSALQFTGAASGGQYLILPVNTPFPDSQSFTISCWASVAAYGYPLISANNTNFSITPSTYDNYLYVGTNGYLQGGRYMHYIVSSAVTLNTWFHCTFTINSALSMQIYLNGVLQGSATGGAAVGTTTTYYWAIGICKVNSWPNFNSTTGSNSIFQGSMDEIRFYNRCLSSAEVAQLYRLCPDEGQ